jgi:hypothetical protein
MPRSGVRRTFVYREPHPAIISVLADPSDLLTIQIDNELDTAESICVAFFFAGRSPSVEAPEARDRGPILRTV